MVKRSAEELEVLVRRFQLGTGILVLLLVVGLIGYVVSLDRRLDTVQNNLDYQGGSADDSAADEKLDLMILHPIQGQVVYVPAYSHVYHQEGTPHLLTITLSVRNTSQKHDLAVKSVRYFDTDGKEVRNYLKQPRRLGPLATCEFLVKRNDTSGGSGANFLVEWVADQRVSEPIVEAVMIDTSSTQGISFVTRGTVISELTSQSE